MYTSFRPGQIWLDTDGKRIQAHGGYINYLNGKYYWYGENKEFTTGKDEIWTYGIRCYSSTDLYNWKDEGLIIPPNILDKNSPLHPSKKIDRPHIIFNAKTKKYVCWFKTMQEDGSQTMSVLTSDNFLGPYKLVHEKLNLLGMNTGDFDLAVASDGKAYIYFDRVHSELICADLNDEYTNVTGYYSTHYAGRMVPYVREAPCHFVRERKHYLITSGTTGYYPNPSDVAFSDTWHGPYKSIGNPHSDINNRSFQSQISCVFKVRNKKDLYIACADRWLSEALYVQYDEIKKLFELCAENKIDEAIKLKKKLKLPEYENTAIADYVWLPIKFKDGQICIDWYDEWKLDDFE